MKKSILLLILVLGVVTLTGCSKEKKYDECNEACENVFTSRVPSAFDEDGRVIRTVTHLNSGYKECKQVCIGKYK